MPGSCHPNGNADYFDDIDAVAVAYARQWALACGEGRRRLRDDLICHCVPLADRLARRYAGRTEPLEDLVQVARLALVKAVDRYDPGRGPFAAFSVTTIRGEIKRHFRDRTWGVHVTRRLQALTVDMRHATTALTNTLGRAPDSAELARYLDVSEEELRQARQVAAGYTPVVLSTPVDDDGRELGDLLGAPDESIELVPDKLAVADLIRALPDRIQRMIILRFYGDRTQAEIAAEFGISQMHVSRLLGQAFTWLRAAMLSDVVPPWTGVDHGHAPDSLHIRIDRKGTAVRVEVTGEVDRDTADRLRQRLRAVLVPGPARRVIVDVAGVPLVDAAGAAVLRDACVTARRAHVALTFTGVQPHVRRVLVMMGVPARHPPAPTAAR
jgi:RNA polymerase sigma-B factor